MTCCTIHTIISLDKILISHSIIILIFLNWQIVDYFICLSWEQVIDIINLSRSINR